MLLRFCLSLLLHDADQQPRSVPIDLNRKPEIQGDREDQIESRRCGLNSASNEGADPSSSAYRDPHKLVVSTFFSPLSFPAKKPEVRFWSHSLYHPPDVLVLCMKRIFEMELCARPFQEVTSVAGRGLLAVSRGARYMFSDVIERAECTSLGVQCHSCMASLSSLSLLSLHMVARAFGTEVCRRSLHEGPCTLTPQLQSR